MGEILPGMYLLAALLAALRLLAEWRRKRRLDAFADPRLMGIAARWPPRFAAALLFAGAVAASAVIVRAPAAAPEFESRQPEACAILIDGGSLAAFAGAPGLARESVERAVEDVLVEGSGMRFSVHAAGETLQQIVPETFDRQGILLMMQGFAPEGGGPPADAVARLCGPTAERASGRKVVVIGARAADDPGGWPKAPEGCKVLMVRLDKGSGPPELAVLDAEGVRGRDPEIVRRFLAQREPADPRQNHAAAPRRLAGLALLLATAEWILAVLMPLFVRRYRVS